MYNDDDFNEDQNDQGEDFKNKSTKDKVVEIYNDNKKMIWVLGIIIVLFIVLSACSKSSNTGTTTTVTPDFIISKESISLRPGNEEYLNVSVTNQDKLDSSKAKTVTWTSSDTNVATVTDGRVMGINYGSSIVTATYIYDNVSYTKSCNVTVADGDSGTTLTNATLGDGMAVYMGIANKYNLVVDYTPSNGYVTNRTYSSNNTNVATVTNDGVVTGVNAGTATITLKVNDKFTSSIKVIVKENLSTSQLAYLTDTVSFNQASYDVTVGNKVKLEFTSNPNNISEIAFDFTSSDTSVATVNTLGEVEGLKVGKTTITIQTMNKNGQMISSRCEVNVKDNKKLVTAITIDSSSSISVGVQGTSTISHTVYPEDATDKTVTYKSSDESVATVSSEGVVTGIKAGSATITITANDGSGISTTVSVTVTTGSSGGSGGDSGSSSSYCGTIKITSSNNSVNASLSDAENDPHEGPAEITINKRKCPTVKYCYYKKGNSECHNMTTYTGTFTIDQVGITILKVDVYNSDGSKRGDTVTKYINLTTSTTATYACYAIGTSRGYSLTPLAWTNNPTRDMALFRYASTQTACSNVIKQTTSGQITKLCFKHTNTGKYVWGLVYGTQTGYSWQSVITNQTTCESLNNAYIA